MKKGPMRLLKIERANKKLHAGVDASETKVGRMIDNYPQPEGGLYNIIRSRWWMNINRTHFMINPYFVSQSEIIPTIHRIYRQSKINKKWIGMTTKKRELEIEAPGHARQTWEKKMERQRNKATMAFFCKFVLASKNKRILSSGGLRVS